MVLKATYRADTPSKYSRSQIESHIIDIEAPSLKRASSLTDPTDSSLQNQITYPPSEPITPPSASSALSSASTNRSRAPSEPPEPNEKIKEDTSTVAHPVKRVKYKDVIDILRDNYHFDENKNSTALDILALYLKGQKIIYMESKTYCEKRLNTLMLPAILLAAVCSILNFILKEYSYGTIIISSLNAANSFILSIINYLKLAEKSQNHLMAAHRFSSLESRLEIQSGHSLFFQDVPIEKSLEEMEKEIKEIQSSNQFLIPEAIRYRYTKIFSSNIFSLVKEIKNDEILRINKLKSAIQKIHEYTAKKDELIDKRSELIANINGYRDEIHNLKLQQETIHHDYDEASDPNEDSIVVWNPKEEPPKLELPADNLSSEDLYQKIGAWKQTYDAFLSKNKESDDYKKQVIDSGKHQKHIAKIEYCRDLKRRESIISTNIRHFGIALDETKDTLREVERDLEITKTAIEKSIKEKDDAFVELVAHRKKYLDLSDDMNREINQHIHKTQKCCNFSPCDFFNT